MVAALVLSTHRPPPKPVGYILSAAWLLCTASLISAGAVHYLRAFNRRKFVENPLTFTIWTSLEVIFWLALLVVVVQLLR